MRKHQEVNYQKFHGAVRELSVLPEWDVFISYLKETCCNVSVMSSDLVRLGSNIGKKELIEEIIILSETKVKKEVEDE